MNATTYFPDSRSDACSAHPEVHTPGVHAAEGALLDAQPADRLFLTSPDDEARRRKCLYAERFA